MRKLKGQKGLSLVEVTIMLLVLMLLTSVLAPSIWDFVYDAQWVKVKEDCEAIGISVSRFLRDNPPCFSTAPGGGTRCEIANRVDLLYGDGAIAAVGALSPDYTGGTGNVGVVNNWNDTGAAANVGTLENHLTKNTIGATFYPTPGTLGNLNVVGPQFGLGWRGGYLAGPIAPDPWGSAYEVNSMFVAAATNAATATNEGFYGWDRDVFCISAGPNKIFQTPFHGCPPPGDAFVPATNDTLGTCRGGDDWTFIIQGSTR
jgi:hypothetical protein